MNIYILNATHNGKLMTELLCEKTEIRGIIGLDHVHGKQNTPEYFNYDSFCMERQLEYIAVDTYILNADEDKKKLSDLEIDLLIVGSWQRLLPQWLIDKCRYGIIGAHGSPEGITGGRGRSPQNWALLLGEKQFTLSIFWIDKGIDSGAVIDTRQFEIDETDDILVSYIKVNLLKAEMIIHNLENGNIVHHRGRVQSAEGFYLPKRTKADGMIDWNRSCKDIYYMVRALTRPYPGAYTIYGNKEYIIWQVRPVNISIGFENRKNGEIVSIVDGQPIVKCKEGYLLIQDAEEQESFFTGMKFTSADYVKQIQNIVNRHRAKYNTPIADMVLKETEAYGEG